MRCAILLAVALLSAPAVILAGGPANCVTADEAARAPGKDVCITAHIYEVVELPDGTRFLDVCPPEMPDDSCRFTIVSLPADRREVGDLARYRNADVRIRGAVQPLRGRYGMMLSHARQFYGGPPKFRPNPKLMHGFDADRERKPVHDPNLRAQGGRRAFMDAYNQGTHSAK
jgi:hypothetical protein